MCQTSKQLPTFRETSLPSQKIRWEKNAKLNPWVSQTWVASMSHLTEKKTKQFLYIPGGDHRISRHQQGFFLAINRFIEQYPTAKPTIDVYGASAGNTYVENPLQNRYSIYSTSDAIWSLLSNIFRWYLKPIVFQPRTFKHKTQTRCFCHICHQKTIFGL